jgi:hypothetical protein
MNRIVLHRIPHLQTWAWAIIKALPEVCGIWQRCGLHPGDKFQDWIRDILKKEKIATVQQLQDRMDLAKSGLTIREGVTPPDNRASMVGDAADVSKAELKLVTSDIVTQTKVVFPEDAKLYYAVSRDKRTMALRVNTVARQASLIHAEVAPSRP